MGQTSSVDTRAILDAGQALAGAARLAHDARGTASRATDGAGWAVDGTLPRALGRYAAAERAATAGPAGPVGVPASGASRDASARPWG